MPTLAVRNDVTFYYTDSGAPGDRDYRTLFLIHGHSFHSGTFQRLAPHAASRGVRIISLNRQEYPGSTPYSEEERRILLHGDETDMERFLHQQGLLIALFIDGLLQELSLPKRVAVAGWSLGNTFSIALLATIDEMPEGIKERLTDSIDHFFLWDPACTALGTPISMDHPLPLKLDKNATSEERGVAFVTWVTGYYQHSSLREPSSLNYNAADPAKKNTFALLPEELDSVIAFGASVYDTATIRPGLAPAIRAQVEKVFFDPNFLAKWNGLRVWCIYGEASIASCISAAWTLEERAQTARIIQFKPLPGANHFFMWDEPERTLDVLVECFQNQDTVRDD